jgi:hypothetical protein
MSQRGHYDVLKHPVNGFYTTNGMGVENFKIAP